MIKLLYWCLVAIDVSALLLFFLLGLAAAGSSRTSPLLVFLLLLVLPALPLAGSVVMFVRSTTPLWRGIAFALAAAPLVVLVSTQMYGNAVIRSNSNASGELTFFMAGPQRVLVEAIRRNDAVAVAAIAAEADVNASGMDSMTPLVAALRQLRATPMQQDVLKALLAAGADPNAGTPYERPLEMALQIDDEAGAAPVRMLLEAGADPNRMNSSGTPIFFAGLGAGGDVESMTALLEHGANLQLTATNGSTVLHYAALARNWRGALFLLEQGADWKQGRSPNGKTFADMVEEAVQQSRGDIAGARRDDDGLQDVVRFLGER